MSDSVRALVVGKAGPRLRPARGLRIYRKMPSEALDLHDAVAGFDVLVLAADVLEARDAGATARSLRGSGDLVTLLGPGSLPSTRLLAWVEAGFRLLVARDRLQSRLDRLALDLSAGRRSAGIPPEKWLGMAPPPDSLSERACLVLPLVGSWRVADWAAALEITRSRLRTVLLREIGWNPSEVIRSFLAWSIEEGERMGLSLSVIRRIHGFSSRSSLHRAAD